MPFSVREFPFSISLDFHTELDRTGDIVPTLQLYESALRRLIYCPRAGGGIAVSITVAVLNHILSHLLFATIGVYFVLCSEQTLVTLTEL